MLYCCHLTNILIKVAFFQIFQFLQIYDRFCANQTKSDKVKVNMPQAVNIMLTQHLHVNR